MSKCKRGVIDPSEKCVICEDLVLNGKRWTAVRGGLKTVIRASEQRDDGKALLLSGVECVNLHESCRANYTNHKSIALFVAKQKAVMSTSGEEDARRQLRSSAPGFDCERHCLYCGEEVMKQFLSQRNYPKSRRTNPIHCVQTVENTGKQDRRGKEQAIREEAAARGPDEWANQVLDRLNKIGRDLVSAEAKYHRNCSIFFSLGRNVSDQSDTRAGRPVDAARNAAFGELCKFLEASDECQYSLSELEALMYGFGAENYSRVYLKKKLVDQYAKGISITEIPGQPSVVNFTGTTNKVLYDKWYSDRKPCEDEERCRIVKTAAEIIREDMRAKMCPLDVYPDASEMLVDQLPESLNSFLNVVISSKSSKNPEKIKKKRASIGQAIMSACRPKSFLSPVLLGLGVSVHRRFASRELVDILHSLGFSVGYAEVKRYEHNAAEAANTDSVAGVPGQYIQYAFDNADSNVRTLDGHGTFHSMGGIRMSTPASETPSAPIPRLPLPTSAADVATGGQMKICWYTKPKSPGLKQIKIRDLSIPPEVPKIIKQAVKLDCLWMCGEWAGVPASPSWSGYMKKAMDVAGTIDCTKSGVEVLPFINMDPGNLTTIFSALKFAAEECRKHGQKSCLVTFDQPLYIKAVEIVASDTTGELQIVTPRLGGFHLLMSYMGAIGKIMSGSGLDELWSQVYARGSVGHMMSGHAYSRSLRAHFLTQAALGTIILGKTESLDEVARTELRRTHVAFIKHEDSLMKVVQSGTVQNLADRLNETGESMSRQSLTGRLWWQYFRQVQLLRLYLRAERTGDWDMHLFCIKAMLPHFHAAGHLPYAKAAHLYVQQMEDLPNHVTTEEYRKITEEGYFTIRRKHEFWSGVWSDMVIEQDLMRPMKVQGGLTRGRGITDNVLTQWVLSMPAVVKLCEAVEQLSGVYRHTSEQHVELRDSRRRMDQLHLSNFISWLQVHSPFDSSIDSIRSLATGVVGERKVNCYDAEKIGRKAMEEMVGKNFGELHLKRNDRVTTLACASATTRSQKEASVNTNLLFLRMCRLGINSSQLREYLRYELASQPPSLFDKGLMRHNQKSVLTQRFHVGNLQENHADSSVPTEEDESLAMLGISSSDTNGTSSNGPLYRTVLDGGFLLHVVVWPNRTPKHTPTYEEICGAYVRYVQKHFKNTVVVFDGYEVHWSTKCEEQKRRMTCKASPNVDFNAQTYVTIPKEDFLSNTKNKANFIRLLKQYLLKAGVEVVQADADADVMIVQAALDLDLTAGHHEVIVVATDTDILVMLIARARDATGIKVLHPGTGVCGEKCFAVSNIRLKLGEMTKCVLFAHAFTGCDTTSAIFLRGKLKGWDNLSESPDLRQKVQVFNCPDANPEVITSVGEMFMLTLYKDQKCSSLDELRFYEFNRIISGKPLHNEFKPAVLPPTSAAAKQHSFRSYLQVQQWLGNSLNPTEWGWRAAEGTLVPVPTLLPAVPEALRALVSCTCKTGCGPSTTCSCRSAGSDCNSGCGNCRGQTCSNTLSGGETDLEDL